MPKADSSSPTRSSTVTSEQSEASSSRAKSLTSKTNKKNRFPTADELPKLRLTADQKNTNHKDAENKRRNAIRDQFFALSEIVPGAKGQERSEYVMLKKTVKCLKAEMDERRRLVKELEGRGGLVQEDMRLGEEDWGGKAWMQKGLEEWCKSKGKDINNLDPDGMDEEDG